jgi:cytochrome c
MKLLILNVTTAICFWGLSQAYANDLTTETYSNYANKEGEITLPENFRQHWVHLGSWVVNDAKAPGYGFHDVYTQADAVKSYARTGKFPDGTVLVKEIRKFGSGVLTTGDALWATENAVWFVMVKDDKGRFKGNPNWSEGWGWALFEAKKPKLNVSAGFQNSCLRCHLPAKQTDWVFIQGYPTLKSK